MYDPRLIHHITAGIHQLETTLRDHAPHLAPGLTAWLNAGYFTHENRFPMLLLPWWLSEQAGIQGEDDFQGDVVRSTIAGYLAIRLIDDTLDGAKVDKSLLSANLIFVSEFQRAYDTYFPTGHPFWGVFTGAWYGAADFAADHKAARDFDARVAGRLGPALIPMAAVAHHASRPGLFDRWSPFLGSLSRFEQLLDDITDWVPDAERGAPNYMLALCPPGEPVAPWVMQEGLKICLDRADQWLGELRGVAESLESEGARAFLRARSLLVVEMREELEPGLDVLAKLRAAFEHPTHPTHPT